MANIKEKTQYRTIKSPAKKGKIPIKEIKKAVKKVCNSKKNKNNEIWGE